MAGSYLGQLARRVGVRQIAGAAGYEIVRRHYYSPIPDLDRLPSDIWREQSRLRGVKFDIAAGLRFLEQNLAPYIAEYNPPREPTSEANGFYLDNGFYEAVDAETLYAMIRHVRPRQIIELGSGFSTLVIAAARARNGDVEESHHTVYDPYPDAALQPVLREVATLQQLSATDVPLEAFAQLQAGDLLFVDTTHTVKIGSDVNRVVLDVLPTLAPGVYVQFHDIYLPWEYPREFLVERRFFWAEQYLLQAFLAFNDAFELLFGTHALTRTYPEAISTLVPSATQARWPSAFWLRRVDPK